MREKLKILLFSSFFITLSAGLLGPIYALFVEEIGGNLLIAGGAAAAFSIASGILIFIMGKVEDKIKRQENILIFGRFLTFIGIGGYLLVKSPVHLFAVEILLGIAAALETPAFDSLYSKNLQKGKYASQWGSWEAMSALTAGVAAIIGGYIAYYFGFNILLITMTVIAAISLIVTLLLRKEIKKMFLENLKLK